MKYFYEEITELKIVTHELFGPEVDKKEADKIMDVVRSTVHHKVLDEILSLLDEKTKEEFYEILSKDTSHKTSVEKLKIYISDIEKKVADAVDRAEKEIYKLIIGTKK